ncbi:MAG: glycosyltransferase family 2 protein [Leptolyngbyaceae cyanobacterium T60_A2020_046]|nr:glycosyltransferase family 2 protein [Leptolyngbyaceae cyanobacterium T60_A2020_046]
MVNFTVAIPTYNGAARLPQVLDALRSQIDTDTFTWEVLVVDNNSHDDTAALVQRYQTDWPTQTPLRYCFEAKQGLAYARQHAIDAARGEWVAFVDDDVITAPDWLAAAHRFSQEHPTAGAYGGQVHPAFEGEPPANFKRIQSFLAIRERGETPHRYDPAVLNMPPGAALVVSKSAWQNSVPRQLRLVGRVNGMMLSGEDFEALLHLHQKGWEIWYNPAMHSFHQIPPHRLEKPYLLKLAQGCGLCVCHLRVLNAPNFAKPFIMLKITLGGLKRTIAYWIKHRGKINTDPILACELQFLQSSWISPFFWFWQLFTLRRA